MGCKELDIRDYYQLVEPSEKSHSRAQSCTEKTPYSGFSHTVISNYRYYNPSLGRWLSRDPINQVGSPAWLKFNQEDTIKEKIEDLSLALSTIDRLHLPTIIMQKITQKIALLNLKFLKLTALSNSYNYVSNNPIDHVDLLGLHPADPFIDQMVGVILDHVGRKAMRKNYEECLKLGKTPKDQRCGDKN